VAAEIRIEPPPVWFSGDRLFEATQASGVLGAIARAERFIRLFRIPPLYFHTHNGFVFHFWCME
jgi:hypothetical protein